MDVLLANCAGMNIQPSELKAMTLWEYEGLLAQWNKAHTMDSDIEPASVEQLIDSEQYFLDNPHLLQ